jgi:transitional endoplasmic reticulum ATPase
VTVKAGRKELKGVGITSNVAYNLALNANDLVKLDKISKVSKVKKVATEAGAGAEEEESSSEESSSEDPTPLTFAPTESSLAALSSSLSVPTLSNDDLLNLYVTPYLSSTGYIRPNSLLTLTSPADGTTCSFVVSSPSTEIVKVTPSTHTVTVSDPVPKPIDSLGYESVGGCSKQVSSVRELIELPLRFPQLWESAGVPKPKGVLMHGPPGSGKTLLANALVEETGAYVVTINGPSIMSAKGGESESQLRAKFEEATANAPSIIFMDEIDAIAPKRDNAQGETEKRLVSQLMSLMDNLKGNVMVIGATNRPNTIESSLRRPGRFDRELDVGIPDVDGRLEILKIKTRTMRLAPDVDLVQIAKDSHGYVGADISQVCLEASLQCLRTNLESLDVDSEDPIPEDKLARLVVDMSHFMFGLSKTNPSTLRDSNVEVPDVKWEDVGGLEDTKRELQEMVKYPIEHKDLFEQFGMSSSRGVLFYGPPGCGKTLLAKAIANECGANFISVKGPELLNAWFGGSEANVRNLFEKARAASPCILFFDEIDSIARARGGSGGGGSDTSDRVINQILSEIDGMGSAKTVFIIGATNRPDILDGGLMRPGRLDQLIYIPLPDFESRVSIFKAALRKSPIAKDITFKQLADVTEGFSGADLSEICQRAAKNAIRDSIEAQIALDKRVVAGEITQEEADGMSDPVPCITKEHFEASMSKARRSVTPEVVEQYKKFQKSIKQDFNMDKGGGEGGGGGGVYDLDRAAAAQKAEDESLANSEVDDDDEEDSEEYEEEEKGSVQEDKKKDEGDVAAE